MPKTLPQPFVGEDTDQGGYSIWVNHPTHGIGWYVAHGKEGLWFFPSLSYRQAKHGSYELGVATRTQQGIAYLGPYSADTDKEATKLLPAAILAYSKFCSDKTTKAKAIRDDSLIILVNDRRV